MAKTLVLIGYSCAGKSTIARHFDETHPTVVVRDSDKFVAGYGDEASDRHIYEVYLNSDSRQDALEHVEEYERMFLESLQPSDRLLVVASPILPRPSDPWARFVETFQPSFLYLVQDAETVRQGLLDRQRRLLEEKPELSSHTRLWSWDEDQISESADDGTWRRIGSDQEQLVNIRNNMATPVGWYEQLAGPSYRLPGGQFHEDAESKQAAIRMAEGLLDLS